MYTLPDWGVARARVDVAWGMRGRSKGGGGGGGGGWGMVLDVKKGLRGIPDSSHVGRERRMDDGVLGGRNRSRSSGTRDE